MLKRKSDKDNKTKMKDSHTKHGAQENTKSADKQYDSSFSETAAANLNPPPDKATESQYAELNDKYLRLYSDFDNFRKRTLKEKIELNKYASADIIGKLLPVLDDFERAIRAIDPASDGGIAVREGLVLIFSKFLSILNQQGLEQMRTAGEVFDTDFHEAITNIPAPTPEQKGKIVDEIEKGYLLNGKVIRYAKVVVGS
jgi:molecular chaperone GrpE